MYNVKIQHCCFLILLFLSYEVCAIGMESAVKKAHAVEPKQVILCSPDGKNGGELPAIAIAKLKEGTELKLLPGRYPNDIQINCNKIILSSEGTAPCYCNIKIAARDVIVRNLNHIGELVLYRDTILVDSMLYVLRLVGFSKEKTDVFIYNTGLNYVRSFTDNAVNLSFKNCTVKGEFYLPVETRVNIEDSILYSPNILFRVNDHSSRKGRLYLKNNLLFAKSGLGKYGSMSNEMHMLKKAKYIITVPKDLKKIWGVVLAGENKMEEPKFILKSFFLAEDSPGQGIGLIPDEHPFYRKPEPVVEKKPVVAPKVGVVLKPRRPHSLKPNKIQIEKKPSAGLSSGGLGGIPLPPE